MPLTTKVVLRVGTYEGADEVTPPEDESTIQFHGHGAGLLNPFDPRQLLPDITETDLPPSSGPQQDLGGFEL